MEGFPPDKPQISRELLQKVPTLAQYPLRAARFQRGEQLIRYQERLTRLSFLVEGRVKVFRVMENGRSVLHAIFEGIQVMGDLELMLGCDRATTDVVAITDGMWIGLPLAQCRDQIVADVEMLRFLGGELARKLDHSSRQWAQNLLFPLPARLAVYMLFSAQDGLFSDNLTRASELLATSYRHLLRTLKGFCESGMIRRCASGYRILDPEALRRAGESILREQG